jgi:hypothetical protein
MHRHGSERFAMRRQLRSLVMIIALPLIASAAAGCASQNNPYAYDEPGATLMADTPAGYTLTNHHLRLLIDTKTGDAISFGPARGGDPIGIAATRSGALRPTQGYLEARDIETWEYLGNEIGSKISWRKIYCLDGDRLLVTYLIRNEGKVPIDTQIGIAPLPIAATQPASTQPAATQTAMSWRFEGPNSDAIVSGSYRIKCFNESIVSAPRPTELLRNDARPLAPGEGIAWTMVWTYSPR